MECVQQWNRGLVKPLGMSPPWKGKHSREAPGSSLRARFPDDLNWLRAGGRLMRYSRGWLRQVQEDLHQRLVLEHWHHGATIAPNLLNQLSIGAALRELGAISPLLSPSPCSRHTEFSILKLN